MPEHFDETFDPATTSPSDVVVDYIAEGRRIKNPDDVVGLCSECKSTQPHSYMEKNVFAQEGVPPVCRFCGGVVVITYAELQGEDMNHALDRNRGLGTVD